MNSFPINSELLYEDIFVLCTRRKTRIENSIDVQLRGNVLYLSKISENKIYSGGLVPMVVLVQEYVGRVTKIIMVGMIP